MGVNLLDSLGTTQKPVNLLDTVEAPVTTTPTAEPQVGSVNLLDSIQSIEPEPASPKAPGPFDAIRDRVVGEAVKYVKDIGAFSKALAQTLPAGGPIVNPGSLGRMEIRDAEQAESIGRGAVNVGAMMVPFGKGAQLATKGISNLLVRRMAQVELNSIAAMSTWLGAQAAVEGENVPKALGEGVLIGGTMPIIGKALGPVTRPIVKTGLKAVGLTGKALAFPLKGAERLAQRNDQYIAVRDALGHFADRALFRGEHVLRKYQMGHVADQVAEVRTEGALLTGKWQAELEEIGKGLEPTPFSRGKAKKALRNIWGKMLDASDEDATKIASKVPEGEELLQRRARLKETLNEVADMAEQSGVTQIDAKTGHLRYFIRRKDWGLPHVYVNLEKMVKPGKLQNEAIASIQEQYPKMSRERAIKILEGLHQRQVSAMERDHAEGIGYANLQGRRYNLPGYNLDPFSVLPEYFNHMARRIVNHRRFGAPLPEGALENVFETRLPWTMKDQFPGAFQALAGITDPAQRKIAERILTTQLGGVETDYSASKWIKAAQRFQIVKLGLSQVNQLSQFGSAFVESGFKGGLRDLFKLAAKDPELHVALSRTGAYHETLARQAMAEITGGSSGFSSRFLGKTGFTKMDTVARQIAATRGFTMAQHQAEKLPELLARRDIASGLEKKYIEHQIASIEKKFAQLGIDAEKIVKQGGVLEQDDLSRAGLKISTNANFWGDSLSLPEFWRSPWGRVLTMFKSFSYQQSAFIKHAVIDPAVKDGDIAPLLRLLAMGTATGEVIGDARSALQGRHRDKKGFDRVVEDLGYGAVFGIVQDGLRATSIPGGAAGLLLGPSVGDVVTSIEGVAEAAHGRPRKLGKKIIQVAPAMMGPLAPYAAMASPAIQNLVFPPKGQ